MIKMLLLLFVIIMVHNDPLLTILFYCCVYRAGSVISNASADRDLVKQERFQDSEINVYFFKQVLRIALRNTGTALCY